MFRVCRRVDPQTRCLLARVAAYRSTETPMALRRCRASHARFRAGRKEVDLARIRPSSMDPSSKRSRAPTRRRDIRRRLHGSEAGSAYTPEKLAHSQLLDRSDIYPPAVLWREALMSSVMVHPNSCAVVVQSHPTCLAELGFVGIAVDEPDLRQSWGAASLVRRVRANSAWTGCRQAWSKYGVLRSAKTDGCLPGDRNRIGTPLIPNDRRSDRGDLLRPASSCPNRAGRRRTPGDRPIWASAVQEPQSTES